jgi:hypothetical protein
MFKRTKRVKGTPYGRITDDVWQGYSGAEAWDPPGKPASFSGFERPVYGQHRTLDGHVADVIADANCVQVMCFGPDGRDEGTWSVDVVFPGAAVAVAWLTAVLPSYPSPARLERLGFRRL